MRKSRRARSKVKVSPALGGGLRLRKLLSLPHCYWCTTALGGVALSLLKTSPLAGLTESFGHADGLSRCSGIISTGWPVAPNQRTSCLCVCVQVCCATLKEALLASNGILLPSPRRAPFYLSASQSVGQSVSLKAQACFALFYIKPHNLRHSSLVQLLFPQTELVHFQRRHTNPVQQVK